MTTRLIISFLILFCSAEFAAATDTYREPWHWGNDFLSKFMASARSTPTLAAFKHFRFGPRTSMQRVVAAFGMPSGFAHQYPVTRNNGIPAGLVAGSTPESGTFRYPLEGGEAFVTVRDLRVTNVVTLFDSKGQEDVIYRRDSEERR